MYLNAEPCNLRGELTDDSSRQSLSELLRALCPRQVSTRLRVACAAGSSWRNDQRTLASLEQSPRLAQPLWPDAVNDGSLRAGFLGGAKRGAEWRLPSVFRKSCW